MENQETINKLRRLYNESTNETAKAGAKAKLEKMGVSLTDDKPKASLSQEAIDKLRRLYNESTNETAKAGAKAKLESAGISLSGEEPKKKGETTKSEPKKTKTKVEPKAKTESKAKATEKDPYDCDDLIKQAKERKAKAKANAIKRANAPKKTAATKNKERVEKATSKVEKNIEVRAKKGEVKVAELEKLISEYEDAIKKLKALLTKVKSGKKFAKGGNMGMMDSEDSNEFHKIKDHHCKCKDKMEHGGGVGSNKNAKYLSSISIEKKTKILQNIAKHYGVSVKEAENEVNDDDAEDIYEYIANDNSLRMSVYTDFKSKNNKMSKGGNTEKYEDWEMIVISKELNKDGGKFNKDRFLVSARNIDEAKKIATELWKKDFSDSDLSIEKVMSESLYRLKYMDKYGRGGKVVVRGTSIAADKKYRALKEGKRESRKFANVEMRGGGYYSRRNANQYGKTKGRNTYYEYNQNRTDKQPRIYLEKGGNLGLNYVVFDGTSAYVCDKQEMLKITSKDKDCKVVFKSANLDKASDFADNYNDNISGK